MASDIDFVNYVSGQIKETGEVLSKKMFGEYLIYVNKKPIILVCDNTAFVKMLDCVKEILGDGETGFPYKGAKEHYALDVDNKEKLVEIVRALEKITPIPKRRVKK